MQFEMLRLRAITLIIFNLLLYLNICTVIGALPQGCCPLWKFRLKIKKTTKPKLKVSRFCFDCIIWTSAVPAGAL